MMKILQEGERIAVVIYLNSLDDIIYMFSSISREDFIENGDILTFTLMESRVKLDRLIKKMTKK